MSLHGFWRDSTCMLAIALVATCVRPVRAEEAPASVVDGKIDRAGVGPRFAYVYFHDEATATSIRSLLQEAGCEVEFVALDDVPTTDFARCSAVIIAADIKRGWSASAAKKILESHKPVLGLGEGGASYFEQLHLQIGWMQCWMGADVGVRIVRNQDSAFWTTVEFPIPDDGELVLYCESKHLGCYAPSPQVGVVPLGQELRNTSHYPLIQQDGRNVLWGFEGSPQNMTRIGKQLFLHTCRYVAQAALKTGKGGGTSVAAATTTSPPDTPSLEEIAARLRDVETRLKTLERSSPKVEPQTSAGRHARRSPSLLGSLRKLEIGPPIRPISPSAGDEFDASTAVYLAYGDVDAVSTLVQVSCDGSAQSTVEAPFPLSSLASDQDALVATVATSRTGQGRVLAIQRDGSVETLFRDPDLLPDTIELWSSAESTDVLVADNVADVIVSVPKDRQQAAKTLFKIEGHGDCQSMSVAKCVDGSILYSGSDLQAVYRQPEDSGPTLREAVLQGQAAVAADPHSHRWAAALRDKIHIFEGDRELASYDYPEDFTMWRPLATFAPNGRLIVGLLGGSTTWFYSLNVETGEFGGLFSINEDRVTGLAVGPAMEW